MAQPIAMAERFRGLCPIVIDVETAGFNAETNALLELAAYTLKIQEGLFEIDQAYHYHILPFEGAHLDPEALAFTGIDPFHPFRAAVSEEHALKNLFKHIRHTLKVTKCKRAVLVGHNPWFDLSFIQAVVQRHHLKKNPFHTFTTLDTAALSALRYGETVLAKAVEAAGLPFNQNEAHSALYDAKVTAQLFCQIVNTTPFSPLIKVSP